MLGVLASAVARQCRPTALLATSSATAVSLFAGEGVQITCVLATVLYLESQTAIKTVYAVQTVNVLNATLAMCAAGACILRNMINVPLSFLMFCVGIFLLWRVARRNFVRGDEVRLEGSWRIDPEWTQLSRTSLRSEEVWRVSTQVGVHTYQSTAIRRVHTRPHTVMESLRVEDRVRRQSAELLYPNIEANRFLDLVSLCIHDCQGKLIRS